MEQKELPPLSNKQVETLCMIAEDAARKHILAKLRLQQIDDFDITVETDGLKPVTVSVDVQLELSPVMKNYDAEKLAKEAVKEAFEAIEAYLEELACRDKQKKY